MRSAALGSWFSWGEVSSICFIMDSRSLPSVGLLVSMAIVECRRMRPECLQGQFGKFDILVNGAVGNFLVSPEDLTPKGFPTVLEIDTVGTYTVCYEAMKYLKKSGPGKGITAGGLIINISATLHYTAAWYQIHVPLPRMIFCQVDGRYWIT